MQGEQLLGCFLGLGIPVQLHAVQDAHIGRENPLQYVPPGSEPVRLAPDIPPAQPLDFQARNGDDRAGIDRHALCC